jgi:hypothetical protein
MPRARSDRVFSVPFARPFSRSAAAAYFRPRRYRRALRARKELQPVPAALLCRNGSAKSGNVKPAAMCREMLPKRPAQHASLLTVETYLRTDTAGRIKAKSRFAQRAQPYFRGAECENTMRGPGKMRHRDTTKLYRPACQPDALTMMHSPGKLRRRSDAEQVASVDMVE